MRLTWIRYYSQSCAAKIFSTVMHCCDSLLVRISFLRGVLSYLPVRMCCPPINNVVYRFNRGCLANGWRCGLRSTYLTLFVDMLHYSLAHESAIAEHLLSTVTCGFSYSVMFFVLHRIRMKHHRNILEAVVINTSHPTQAEGTET